MDDGSESKKHNYDRFLNSTNLAISMNKATNKFKTLRDRLKDRNKMNKNEDDEDLNISKSSIISFTASLNDLNKLYNNEIENNYHIR